MMSSRYLKMLGIAAIGVGASFCAGSGAFREAREQETLQHWDAAVIKYARALDMNPGNSAYKIALQRAKIKASQSHFEKGKIFRASGRPELAVVELEQAAVLDSTNQYAETELKKAREEAEKLAAERAGTTKLEEMKKRVRGSRPRAPMLEPASDKPINLNFPQQRPIKQIYQALASASGINVIFDPQLKDDNVSIVLTNMNFQNALETLMRQENHFYKIIDEKSILIAADTPANRKTYEDLVLRTFYLSNGDITDVSNALRNLLQTTRIYPNKAENSITLRDTADKVAIAERIIEQNDKQLAEVVVDVELLQVNTKKLQDVGLLLSSYSSTASAPAPGATTDLGSTIAAGGAFTWDQLRQITIRSLGFSIPSATLNLIKNNTDAELLAKPQLRISEGQKAQLIIGDKVPIPTTTFNTANVTNQGIVPITSFQYQDVGIKIEVEPRVHHNKEVTMKLAVEVSNLNGSVPVGTSGQEQPIIGTRSISSNIRLKDGETNFLAGLYRNDKTFTREGVPFLSDIPVFGRLLGRRKTDTQTTDLVLTLTPHIIRIPDITEEDLAPLYVGTDANISFAGTPRIETPGIPGPFDFQRPAPAPPPPRTTPGPVNLAPGGPPSDIFSPRNLVPTQPPQPTPLPRPFNQAVAVPVSGVSFDFDPASVTLAVGQQRSILIRATGEETMTNTSIAIRFDPAVVAAIAVRPILSESGVADAHIEKGRVVVEIPSAIALSGTRAVAEITLEGIAPGKSSLAFEKTPSDGATTSSAAVEVK